MDDQALVRRLIAGEAHAWDGFVRGHVDLLYAAVGSVLRRAGHAAADTEVEDAVQAVFTKLWAEDRRRLKSFRGRAKLSTWLVAVARREALDRLRRKRVQDRVVAHVRDQARLAPTHRNGDTQTPAKASAARDGAERLGAALRDMPGRDRLLLQLVEVDGLTYAQTAELLDLRENSIGPLLQRARRRLRTFLPAEPP